MELLDELLDRVRARRELPPPAMRRAIREAAGLTLEDFGGALGVSSQAVLYWERGTRFPRPEHLGPYSELLRALTKAGE